MQNEYEHIKTNFKASTLLKIDYKVKIYLFSHVNLNSNPNLTIVFFTWETHHVEAHHLSPPRRQSKLIRKNGC